MIYLFGKNSYISKELSKKMRGEFKYITKNKDDSSLYLDLKYPATFDYSVLKKGDIIVFFAAISSPDECEIKYSEVYKINVLGTSYFIEKCIENGVKVLFLSSDAVYGEKNESGYSKEVPIGKYGEMKLKIEREFENTENFKSIRLSYVFSKEDKFTQYIINCSEKGECAQVFHPYERRIVYLQDILECINRLVENWNNYNEKIYNLGGKTLYSKLDIAKLYKRYMDQNLEIEIVTPSSEFYKARAKTINFLGNDTELILNRTCTELESAFKNEFFK